MRFEGELARKFYYLPKKIIITIFPFTKKSATLPKKEERKNLNSYLCSNHSLSITYEAYIQLRKIESLSVVKKLKN